MDAGFGAGKYWWFIGLMCFIMSGLVRAETPYISFNHTDKIDIGREGWRYQPDTVSSTSQPAKADKYQTQDAKNQKQERVVVNVLTIPSTSINSATINSATSDVSSESHLSARTIHPSLSNISYWDLDTENADKDLANYAQRFKLHPDLVGQPLALYIPYQNSINRIRINHQLMVQVNQTTALDGEQQYRVAPRLIIFTPQQNILDIEIEVVNGRDEHHSTNIPYDLGQAVYISKAKPAIQTQALDVFIRTALIGAIFIIGFFTTVFAYYRNREQYYYFFGVFSILAALRAVFATPYLYSTFSNFDWVWSVRLEFVFGEIMTIVFLTYVKHLYQHYFSSVIYYTAFLLMTLLVMVTLLFEPFIFQRLFFYVFSLIVLTSVYFFYLFFKTVKEQAQPYPLGHLLGLIILSFAFFHDFFVYYQIIKRSDVVLYCISVYVFFVTYEMSQIFSRQVGHVARLNKELKALNQNLDEKIHLRTLELKLLNEKLDKQSKTDALTGIYNRGSLNIKLEERFIHCQMQQKSLTIIMIDIDYFKCFNDFYGHLRGDVLIKTVVDIIKATIPEKTFLARYGGEEFVLILEDATPEFAYHIATQICQQVASRRIEHLGRAEPRYVTISIGGIVATQPANYDTVSEVLHLADMQLYAAKMNGRNQVRFQES